MDDEIYLWLTIGHASPLEEYTDYKEPERKPCGFVAPEEKKPKQQRVGF